MIKRFFGSKLIIIFISLLLLGFLIGYDYAYSNSIQSEEDPMKVTNSIDYGGDIQYLEPQINTGEYVNLQEENAEIFESD